MTEQFEQFNLRNVSQGLKKNYSRSRRFFKKVLIYGFIIICAGAIFDQVIMPIFVRQGWEVSVPDLSGMPQKEAEEKLQKLGLSLEVGAQISDTTVPIGVVVSQTPLPGSIIKRGKNVRVGISSGGKIVILSDLSGLTLRQARIKLEDMGLVMGDLLFQEAGELPENQVVRTLPPAGSKLALGKPVTLFISQKVSTDSVLVPNLVGKSMPEGLTILKEMYLELESVKFKVDKEILPGTIISQSLEPGQRVEKGSQIDLVVSTTE